MEVLLLDTTEKEGEDNTLYHYVHCKQGVGCFSTSSTALKTGTTQWLDLRGVLAAAVGATTSLCGESLQCARFGTGDSTGIVGFVNIYEVLYALVFSSTDVPESIVQTSPELPSGIPPLKLNVDDPDALFLREKVAADAGDDISTGDAHIFPEWCNMHMKKGREQRQTAEQIVVCGQPLWIIKNSYESLEVFSILDAALPLELVDRELDRLCAFGGAEPVQQLHSE
ncbi:hypothetical protein JG687_00018786 [Phytophthora cactorum]|uniref:Uncharacterized protein n=1 Tax=Phytophthora cactorum TaxID=29920 RepID=A0A8T1TNW4_9STRA|nr:hypothetical protein JG687_00018786 [Phytophthora cactorum]